MIQVPPAFLVFALQLGATACTVGQCSPPVWSAMNQFPGVAGSVFATTPWDPDGAGPAPSVLVVAGSFTLAGGISANRIATWNGVSWQALGSGIDGDVRSLAVYNGQLVAGGTFSNAGGVPALHLAAWNGVSWHAVGSGFNGGILALTVYHDELVAAGLFTSPVSHIARWNGSSWQPLGSGVNSVVKALTSHGGSLIAAGPFTVAGGVLCNEIARWDGFSWQPVGTGLGPPFSTEASALTVHDGDLIAAGTFTLAGGMPASRIARWNGASWSPLGSGLDWTVNSVISFNGELAATGFFESAGGIPASRAARWDGSFWQPLGTGLDYTGWTLTAYAGMLIAGGDFATAGGVPAPGIARWSGASWAALGAGINGAVSALAIAHGDLVAGGSFTAAGQPANGCNVIRWNGSSWQVLGLGTGYAIGYGNVITAFASFHDELIVGGTFGLIGGQVVQCIARWGGSTWSPLGSGMSSAGSGSPVSVNALTVYDGDLIAAGFFTTAGGVPANSVARWDGDSWHPLGSGITGLGAGTRVQALTVHDGELIAGGSFTTAGGVPATNVARWNGSTWQTLGSGLSGPPYSASVYALAEYEGDLFAGGNFGSVANSIFRWSGSAWVPLGNPTTLAFVAALTVFNGELVAGGSFWNPLNPFSPIARWNGSSWQLLGAPSGGVSAVAGYHGALVAGGSFFTIGGITSPYLARWASPLPLLALSQPSGNGTGMAVTNRWLVPGHEYYNIASLDLAPGGPGTGPWNGLFFSDYSVLLQQLMLPIGAHPFHFITSSTDVDFGPYLLPAGLSFEALSVDVTGGAVGCVSQVQPFTVH